jgi:hypothetical protein
MTGFRRGANPHRGALGTVVGPPIRHLYISSNHFFIFLSILTAFAPELSEFCGKN